MVMSYLIQSNAEYTKRVDEVEERLIKMAEKLELLEYNIKSIMDTLERDLDVLSDILRTKVD